MAVPVDDSYDISKVLVESFLHNRLSGDSTAVNNLFAKIPFDRFCENLSARIFQGVDIGDFPRIVEDIASVCNMPKNVKDSLLDGQKAMSIAKLEQEFLFKKGKPGKYTYFKAVAMKRDENKIDFACADIDLEFELSKKIKVVGRSGYALLDLFLGHTIIYEDMELSANDEDSIKEFSRRRCEEILSKKYPQYAFPTAK